VSLQSALNTTQPPSIRNNERANVINSWIIENGDRSEPFVSYDTFTQSNSQMKALIEQLQERGEKAETAGRRGAEKLKAREEFDSNHLLRKSLTRRFEADLVRQGSVMPIPTRDQRDNLTLHLSARLRLT